MHELEIQDLVAIRRTVARAPEACAPILPRDGTVPLWDGCDLHLLDVRPTAAFVAGHLPDSASLPADELRERVHELPRDRERLVVLAADARAARDAAAAATRPGSAWPIVLAGSVEDWPGPWESGPPRRVVWQPSPAVRAWGGRLPAGRALDLGCGTGRDAAWLAAAGHDVLAVDRLPEALERAESLASRMGRPLRTLRLDLARERPPADEVALILMIRFLDRALLAWAMEALSPGGCLILETFARGALAGPRQNRWLLEPQEALQAVLPPAAGGQAWVLLEYLEGAAAPEPGLTRLVARKPAP